MDQSVKLISADVLRAAQFSPTRIQNSEPAWLGHLPFAAWLIKQLRPSIFVELGTHSGNSYSTFCQAVKEANLSTKCYAVDTWKGDAHSGPYDEAIFTSLEQHHAENYSDFSCLLRMTFDDAVSHFSDHSIDLLHIDGLHTYQAVRHDFETWLPKLSPNAVVLFHDTNVREGDFEVWKFWEELKSSYPSHLEFLHSNGLGVLQLDRGKQAGRLDFLRSKPGKDILVPYFSALGTRIVQSSAERASEREKTLKEVDDHYRGVIREFDRAIQRINYDLFKKQKALEFSDENCRRLANAYDNLAIGYQSIMMSTTWRMVEPLRKLASQLPPKTRRMILKSLKGVYGVLRSKSLGPPASGSAQTPSSKALLASSTIEDPYYRWVRDFDTLTDSDRDRIKSHIDRLTYKPLISVLMPAFDPPEAVFQETIDSVRAQIYPHWELCIADDASLAPYVSEILHKVASEDPRIRWVRRETNGHISAASNSALAISRGDFVALMDHDDLLPEHALYEVAAALNENPNLDIIYSDEDQIDVNGRRHSPYFKTDWNIDLLLAHNSVSHLGVYRRTLLEGIGGFREGFEGSQDYDVALRCADASRPEKIFHIPAILYHWRRDYGPNSFSESQLAKCSDAALRAISDHLERRHEGGQVEPHPIITNWSRVVRPVPDPPPLVSLIVPTRDRADLLDMCITSLLDRTDYSPIEILIVDHESVRPEAIQLFRRFKSNPRIRILPYMGSFNYSAINNMAVAAAKGSIIGLINNDINVIDPNWLSEMVALATLKEVGAVGAKLLYPDNRVQHGGVVLGVGGVANHFGHLCPREDVGYFGRNVLTSSVSAVTGACLIVRKSVFEEVGGLNEVDLAVAFNDVDLCLKIGKRGYRNVWTPHAELYHHESASRGAEDSPEKLDRFRREVEYMMRTWGSDLAHDPFYNDNFSTEIGAVFQLASPPRRKKPWL